MLIKTKECKVSSLTRDARQIVAGLQPWAVTLILEISADEKIDFNANPAGARQLRAALAEHIEKELINQDLIQVHEEDEDISAILRRW